MLYLFAMHPLWYFVPAVITLVLWMAAARFIPPWKGEGNDIMREPGIIVCGSFLWFLVVPGLIFAGIVGLLSWLVGLVVKAR